jgi:protein-tyrosine-phosphatase
MIKPKVLFLCSENSCRTQMAEAFLRDLTGDEFEIVSAGSEAGRLDPEAVEAMREIGIDIAAAETKRVNPYLGTRFQYVMTLCDRAGLRSRLRCASRAG